MEADFGKALRYSMTFYEAQKSGSLAGDNFVDWRGQSATLDAPPGGWYLGSSMPLHCQLLSLSAVAELAASRGLRCQWHQHPPNIHIDWIPEHPYDKFSTLQMQHAFGSASWLLLLTHTPSKLLS